MSEKKPGSRRWLLPVGLGVAVVALVAIALTRGPVELDPDTPEGTVQEYLRALNEKRWDDAVAVVHPQWLGECTGDDLAQFADFDFTAELGRSDTSGAFGGVIIEESFDVVGSDDGVAEDFPVVDTHVEVTISRGEGGAFGSGWNEFVVFEMVDEDDFWWVSGDPWPYFVWNCRGA